MSESPFDICDVCEHVRSEHDNGMSHTSCMDPHCMCAAFEHNAPIPSTPPTPGALPATWDLVIADFRGMDNLDRDDDATFEDSIVVDMRARDEIGTAKYGVRHTAINGRDHLKDAYEEALDQCCYLRGWITAHELDYDRTKVWADLTAAERTARSNLRNVRDVYWKAMRGLRHLRFVMDEIRASETEATS